jgi:hypothetical protein
MMSVEIQSDGIKLKAGRPKVLFHTSIIGPSQVSLRHYTLTSDGKRFLLVQPAGNAATTSEPAPPVDVILNWTGLLNKGGINGASYRYCCHICGSKSDDFKPHFTATANRRVSVGNLEFSRRVFVPLSMTSAERAKMNADAGFHKTSHRLYSTDATNPKRFAS